VTYRAELDKAVVRQLDGFPPGAFDALVAAVAEVADYPDDPIRTFPTGSLYVRRTEFGTAGLVTYRIDDARQTVTLIDVTWAG
jgi:mRNA-degrading endonuclease RelE of RelBE toxin-antitoxin system